ncbi:MAG: hypothetical protein KDD05_04510 [Psychroserpens sp.]|nr:hypothetical protein [Psychroserpens sp.]
MKHIDKSTYSKSPDRYEIVSGKVDGAPLCPYGNNYKWVVLDLKTVKFVRLSYSAFKLAKNNKIMNEIINWVKSKLTKKTEEVNVPSGYCPTCWGHQEYGGEFFEAIKRENIDTNNIDSKKGWIQGYVSKNLTGIQLSKNTEGYICPNCNVSYKLK